MQDSQTANVGLVSQLPKTLTSLVGRSAEFARIAEMLRNPVIRLVTLVGPGGVGKTTLALSLATHLATEFDSGSIPVFLASTRDSRLVGMRIAHAVGLLPVGEEAIIEQLNIHLGNRKQLLIIDNLEHLLPGAPVLTTLLAACPHVKILVTSRAILGLPNEHVVEIQPLPTLELRTSGERYPSVADALSVDAIRLFVERAQEGYLDFVLTDDNLPTIAEICTRLDGLPLAIELAASRIAAIPPSLLLERMTALLPILTSRSRNAPDRHRTMRDAIAWSYALLPSADQSLFRRLTIFPGGFELGHAAMFTSILSPKSASLVSNVQLGLDRLLRHSLVHIQDKPGMPPRYTMLETLREFGLEQVTAAGEDIATRDAHAHCVLLLAEQFHTSADPTEPTSVISALEREGDNIRVALSWAFECQDADRVFRLATCFAPVWLARGPFEEGRIWLERVLKMDGRAPQRLSIEVALTEMTMRCGNLARTITLGEAALEHARLANDRIAIAQSSLAIGFASSRLGDAHRAAESMQLALATRREMGDLPGVAETLAQTAILAVQQGDLTGASELANEARVIWQRLELTSGEIITLDLLSLVARLSNDLGRQATLIRDLLRLSRDITDPLQLTSSLWTAAAIATERRHYAAAARFFGAEETLRDRTGLAVDRAFFDDHSTSIAETHSALGDTVFTDCWMSGRQLGPQRAIDEAIALLDDLILESETAQRVAAETSAALTARGLTHRQAEVLQFIVEGRSDREIAEHLGISHRTVSKHVGAILVHLGVHSRAGAAAVVTRLGRSDRALERAQSDKSNARADRP